MHARSRFGLRTSLAAAATLAMTLPLSGCIIINGDGDGEWSSSRTVKETRRLEVAHEAGTGLSVDSENGGVEVSKTPGAANVVISATVRARTDERLAATRVVAEREQGGTLKVYVLWPDDKRLGNEGCSFEILTPDAKGVDIDTSNGSIRIAGLSGDAHLVSSNGPITVTGHHGAVQATTSNGRITADDVDGRLIAATSNGAVTVTDATGPVEVDTSNGGVDVRLADSSPGPVSVETSNGHVDVVCGRGYAGTLSMATSNGSTRFTDGEGRIVRGKDRLEARIGSGETSRIRTSNGSIEVRVAGASQ